MRWWTSELNGRRQELAKVWAARRGCEGVETRKLAGSAGHENKLSSAEGCGIWEGVSGRYS